MYKFVNKFVDLFELLQTLQKGDGYLDKYTGERVDLTEVVTSPGDSQGSTNYIKVSALSRIFNNALGNSL
jgi:hypothetical protein